ncbi:MAG: hypothetical protein J6T28_03765 [Paludibacteraceae bacterium]|nr:hypothetical protein [Paludibacteraceae bacterium]MBP5480472.1 hypothetical protein [Paludibacteraceae bacterium]
MAYYSYMGNVRSIVDELTKQISADVVEIKPAEEGLKYEEIYIQNGEKRLNLN